MPIIFHVIEMDYNGVWDFHEFFESKDLIKELLAEKCSELDLDGQDRLIYITCINDLFIYLRYLRNNGMETDKKFSDYFARFVLGKPLDGRDDYQFTKEQMVKYNEMSKIFGKFSVNEWWAKFLERTKIVLNEESKNAINNRIRVNKDIDLFMIFLPQELDEIREYLENILLRNGERCFIDLLIDQLCKNYIRGKESLTEHEKIQIMEAMGLEARRMCYSKGPLVWILPNMKARVREWRNDNSQFA